MSAADPWTLRRREVVRRLLCARDRTLVISGLGSPSWDVAAAGDHDANFYLWGAMGGAVMTGLGLALAQPSRRVLVITGDGEMLMGLGSLATVAVQQPVNLAVLVLDNEHYGETGMQPTHTGGGVDLAGIARAAGIRDSRTVSDETALAQLLRALDRDAGQGGPMFAAIKVAASAEALVLPPRDGTLLKHRFRAHLLGKADAGS